MTDKTFNEIFEELAKTNDRSIIWNNWLEYVIDVNLLKLEAGNKESFEKKYYGNEKAYADLMEAWLNELSDKLKTVPYYDMLGEFYEELVQSKSKSKSLGQAFTPPSVTNLLSEIAFNDDKDYNGMLASDPACGSARTLLSAHVKSKGKLFCIGQDLDRTSCYMAVCNLWSMGVRGSILHMDTLTREFHQGWRINRYLYHGIPVPHIELINSEAEAYDFIELNRLRKNNEDIDVVSLTDNDNEDEAVTSTIKTTNNTSNQIQSTLI